MMSLLLSALIFISSFSVPGVGTLAHATQKDSEVPEAFPEYQVQATEPTTSITNAITPAALISKDRQSEEEMILKTDVPVSPEAELALLQTVKARVQLYMELNLSLARQLKKCFDGTYTAEECIIKNDKGYKISRKKQIRDVIRKRYPLMRRTMLLYNMVKTSGLSRMTDIVSSFNKDYPWQPPVTPIEYSVSLFPTDNPMRSLITDNPLTGWTLSSHIEHAPFTLSEYKDAMFGTGRGFIERVTEYAPAGFLRPAIATKTEKTNLDKNFVEYAKEFCRLGMTVHPKYAESGTPDQAHFCNENLKIYPSLDSATGGFYFHIDTRGLNNKDALIARNAIESAFYRFSQKRELMAKQLLEDFYEIVTTHPILLQINSRAPTDQELAVAYERVIEAANKNYISFRQKYPQTFDLGNRDNKDRLILMDYAPVIEHAIQNPSMEMRMMSDIDFSKVAAKLSKERSVMQLKRAGGNILKLVGINLACIIPWGRVLNVVSFTRAVCFSAVNLVTGAYFVSETAGEYRRVYNELFGVPAGIAFENERDKENELDTGERYLTEMSTLRTAERFLILDIVTAPIGGTVAIKYFAQSGKVMIRSSLAASKVAAKAAGKTAGEVSEVAEVVVSTGLHQRIDQATDLVRQGGAL
jgi:hypothetical protein